MKERILNGEILELWNTNDVILLWWQKRTNSYFLMLNSKIIKQTRAWKPIQKKLADFENLKEMNLY